MAIFNQRVNKVLRFLLEENYTNQENIAKLLDVPKQTASRVCKYLCNKEYLYKHEIDIGLARTLTVYAPTNTGMMFAIDVGEDIPELREVYRVNANTIYHDLKLQQIRLDLETQGYTDFKSSWYLMRQLRRHKDKVPIVPDYTCINPNGERVAIEYECTIKSRKRYQEIIGQYMDVKDRGVIKQVIYFTDDGFADKLKQLFASIEYIYRNNKTEKITQESLKYFYFI